MINNQDLKDLEAIRRLEKCGSVQSFLQLSDDDKAKWFSMMVIESSRRKSAETMIEDLKDRLLAMQESYDGYIKHHGHEKAGSLAIVLGTKVNEALKTFD